MALVHTSLERRSAALLGCDGWRSNPRMATSRVMDAPRERSELSARLSICTRLHYCIRSEARLVHYYRIALGKLVVGPRIPSPVMYSVEQLYVAVCER